MHCVVEGDLQGRPFNHDQRALVYARSKEQEDNHGFGTEAGCLQCSTVEIWSGNSGPVSLAAEQKTETLIQ